VSVYTHVFIIIQIILEHEKRSVDNDDWSNRVLLQVFAEDQEDSHDDPY